MFRSHRLAAALVLAPVLACSGAASGAPAAGQTVGGIRCERTESGVFHIHQHLAIYDRGKPVPIPADVGRPLLGGCLYWLHTHTPDGIIHIESPTVRTFRLGEFFDLWGERLDATHLGPVKFRKGALRAYLGGRPYTGDPRKIELTEHADIVLEAGPPYKKPAPFTAWNGL
jgi:hypothetical protein